MPAVSSLLSSASHSALTEALFIADNMLAATGFGAMADGRRVHQDRGTLFCPRMVLGDDGNAQVDPAGTGPQPVMYAPDIAGEVDTADKLEPAHERGP